VLATDLATECEEQEDVTESPLERRNLFQATSENITLELSREDLLGAIPYTSLGNNTKQILLRIPSSSSAGSFARNMRRENFLDTLLENLSRDKDGGTEQATKWLMTTLAKKNERLFTEVAERTRLTWMCEATLSKRSSRPTTKSIVERTMVEPSMASILAC
jgi:hypothetical protein